MTTKTATPWYMRRTPVKTVLTITEEPARLDTPITYTFKNEAGEERTTEAHDYRAARRALDKQTGGTKGFRLIERRL